MEAAFNSTMVSVIVPVYNVGKYISKCIESIIKQNHENLELILVDDGSIDDSGGIIDKYAQKDARIKVIHNKNQGVSSTRNCGIEMASGDYITFIDADDWISPDYIKYMLHIVFTTNSDFVISTNHFTNRDNIQIISDDIQVWSPEKATAELLYPRITVGCWNKMYKREFLVSNDIRFQTDLFFGEGLRIITDVSQRANHVGVGRRKVYWYRSNPESCTSKHDIKKAVAAFDSLESIKNNLILSSPIVFQAFTSHYWLNNFLALRYMLSANVQKDNLVFYNKCIKYIRHNIANVYKSETSRKVKLTAPLIWISPKFVALIFNFLKQRHESIN